MASMKVFLFLSCMAIAHATSMYDYPYYVNNGNSQQYRSQDETGNYQFGYDEGHSSGGTFRKERGDAFGNKYGSYGLRDADGRYRVVNYVADADGFRAAISSNEPGVAPKDPASTTINKAGYAYPAPATIASKPLLYAPAIHHAASAQYPLLYQTPYAPSYGYYKGTPYTRRSYYRPSKGTPYNKYGYYFYP